MSKCDGCAHEAYVFSNKFIKQNPNYLGNCNNCSRNPILYDCYTKLEEAD